MAAQERGLSRADGGGNYEEVPSLGKAQFPLQCRRFHGEVACHHMRLAVGDGCSDGFPVEFYLLQDTEGASTEWVDKVVGGVEVCVAC